MFIYTLHVYLPSMLAKGVETINKQNKQASTNGLENS